MRCALLLLTTLAMACSSGDGGMPDGATGDGGSIDLAQPPPRPTVDDGPSGPEQVFVLDEVQWDQREDAWRTIGLDLDGLLSSSESGPSECRAPSPSAPIAPDGSRGIDNAFGRDISPILGVARPDAAEAARLAQAEGRGALAVRVREWNGEPDDPRVEVAVFPTVGTGGAGAIQVDPRSVSGGDLEQAIIIDDNAYVSGGEVVLRLPDRAPLPLAYGDDSLLVNLTDASLVFTPGATATLAGRWSTLDFLGASVTCPGTDDFMSLERLLELAADIRALPGTGGDGVVCDAISLGLSFDVQSATLGGVGEELPAASCP
jgi:hypothetical protein